MTRITLMTAAVSALGLMLASGGAMAQATDTQAKARQIVVEAKAEAPAKAETVAKAEVAPEVQAPVAEKTAEAPANDTATLSDEDKAEVAKAIEETKAAEVKKEEPAVKVVEEPAPVVKKKLTSKVVFIERDGEMLKVRKYSNGTYKVLGYAEGYYQPSYSYSYNSGGYGDNCANGY